MFVFLVVVIGLSVISQITEYGKRASEVATKTDLWHDLKAEWDDSHYCRKCDIVFAQGRLLGTLLMDSA